MKTKSSRDALLKLCEIRCVLDGNASLTRIDSMQSRAIA